MEEVNFRFRKMLFGRRQTLFVSILFLTAVSQWLPVAAEVHNRVVAIVNDEVVTLYELNGRMRELTGIPPDEIRKRSEEQYMDVRHKVLDMLINEKIAVEKVKELNITVSEAEVDAAIERVKANNQLTQEDLQAKLEADGTTFKAYREEVRKELERIRLINQEVKSKIFIREEELRNYYNAHIDDFRRKAKIRLAVIFLARKDPSDRAEADALLKKADDLLARLAEGANFSDLAKKYSDGPGAGDGGDLGKFEMSEVNPQLAEHIRDLSAGGVSQPIVTPAGIQLIKVVEKQEGGVTPFEQAKGAIHTILYRQELDKKYAAWLKELREKAYTKIIF
ncbi:MAG: peptidylprolyl isomerase [Deltaproteobacteria bacterium]|nr:peptidylprolyl isomerase [Deltaproteobacteria bacterium]